MRKTLNEMRYNIQYFINELGVYPEFVEVRRRHHTILLSIMLFGNIILLLDSLFWHWIPMIQMLSPGKCLITLAVLALSLFVVSHESLEQTNWLNLYVPILFLGSQFWCFYDISSMFIFLTFISFALVLSAVFYCELKGYVLGLILMAVLIAMNVGIKFSHQLAFPLVMLFFVIPTSFFIIYSNLSRYAMIAIYGRILNDSGRTTFNFDRHVSHANQAELERLKELDSLELTLDGLNSYLQETKLLAVLYNEKGLLKWNRAFEEACGDSPLRPGNPHFENFIMDAALYYGEYQYKDIQFHFKQEYVLKRLDGQVVCLLGEVLDRGKVKVFIGLDHTNRQENDLKLKKYLELKDAMIEINQSVIGIKDIHELLELIVEKTIKVVNNANCGSALKLDSDGFMRVVSSYGFPAKDIDRFAIKNEDTFLFIETNGALDRTVLIDSRSERGSEFSIIHQKINAEHVALSKMKATISSPILINGKFFGSLNIDTYEKDGFSKADIETVDYIRQQVEVALSKHRLYEDTIYLSQFDELTGVYNRRYFESRLKLLIDGHQQFCLVLFDTSHLRAVNDAYGHAVGDAYIGKFAKMLTGYFEEKALIGRYGGDEFIAAFPNLDCNGLITKIEVLNILFSKDPMIMPKNVKIYCQFRYGIAEYPDDAEQLEDLVSLADRNLRSSKER